ncbi:translocation SEC63-like protein, partial [Brachionus plicatilis]
TLAEKEPKKRGFLLKLVLVVGWLVFFYLAYKASQIEIEHKEYDPFAIIGIDRSATDQEIKKRYRERAKVMHPDKGGDAKKFEELAKAYQALTDEETKKNWIEYGNPDGPGVTQFGIALPKWIIDGKNSYIVLGAYILVFMVIMPIIVGTWWYRSIRYTGDQVLIITTQLYNFLIMKSPQMNLKKIIMVLGSSREFERHSNPEIVERPSDNLEVPQLLKDLPELQEKIRELPYSAPYSIKARALIHAHLSRLTLSDTLTKDKNYLIKKCPFLINEMVNIAVNFAQAVASNYVPKNFPAPKLDTIENMMRLSPMIVQALWNKSKSNLLQLPHIEESHLKHFMTKKRNIANIKQFVQTSDSDRRSILRNLTDEQYDDIMRVCTYYPNVEMNYKVNIIDDEDEHTITAGALVTLDVFLQRDNLIVSYANEDLTKEEEEVKDEVDELTANETQKEEAKPKPWQKQQKKTKSKPKAKAVKASKAKKIEPKAKEDSESELEESGSDDEASGNVSASEDKKMEKNSGDDYFEKFQQMQKKKEKLETKAKVSHRVYCPFFADIKQECWWLYVADKKTNNIISSPIYVQTLKDTEEFELKFMAPKTPGLYTYTLILRSDSYIDFDVIKNLKLDVKKAQDIEEHPQWNFTDEEDAKEDEKEVDDEYATESQSE